VSHNPFRPRRARFQRATALFAATLTLSACYDWAVQRQPVGEIVTQERIDHVRITTADGAVRDLTHSRISQDSLFGVPSGGDGPVLAFALADIRKVEVRQEQPLRTIGLIVVAGMAYMFRNF
jgi:hypothetical protein